MKSGTCNDLLIINLMNYIKHNLNKLKYLLVIFLILLIKNADAFEPKDNEVLNITDVSRTTPVGKYVYMFIDKKSIYTKSDIIANAEFELQQKAIPVMDVTKGTVWAKFSVFNSSLDSMFYLDLQYSNISELTLYKLSQGQLQMIDSTGNNIVVSNHSEKRRDFIFRLLLKEKDTSVFYLRIKSRHPVLIPLFIKNEAQLNETVSIENLIFGLYFGIILSLFLYNIFLLISTRDLSYLFYVVYLLSLGLAQIAVSGYGFKYFWPDYPFINRYVLIVTSAFTGITGILFALFFLRVEYYFKKMVYVLYAVILLYFVSIISCISGNNAFSYSILNYAGLIGGLILIVIPYLIARKGYKTANYYLVAWIFFLSGIIILALRNIGVLPYTALTTYSLYLGSAIEAILLSTALADRINTLRQEKEESQAYSLKISRENETLIKEQNVVLEQKVTERTNELQSTNTQLEKTLSDLKDAQTQLVEAEKMASLGQLTAGIAHEINNPINFVKSNIKPLNLDIEDVFGIVDMYNKLHDTKGPIAQQLQKINEKQEEIDLDFVKQEIKQLIKGIEDGAERTAEIVRGLRTFSRLDEGELKSANVHDGLNSTLILLRNSMPAYVRIEKKFSAQGNIECFPGKLNQVFMNILNNAIQAIEEKTEKEAEEWILISTLDIPGDKIQIHIKDSGIGMSEQVKRKIFEPFFTTKSVGVGTGLGMAIVFKIIEEHHGKIEVESEPGKGAEFILTLPYIHPVN